MLLRRALPILFAVGALALMGRAFVVMTDYAGRPAHAAMLRFGTPIGMLDLEHGERIQQWHRVSGNVVQPSQSSKVERNQKAASTETMPSGGYIKRAKMLLFLIRTRHWRALTYEQNPQAKPGT